MLGVSDLKVDPSRTNRILHGRGGADSSSVEYTYVYSIFSIYNSGNNSFIAATTGGGSMLTSDPWSASATDV